MEDQCDFPYEYSGSSSSLSSGSGSVSELYCTARPDKTYYKVQESFESGGRSAREDQATQTDDDEADICDNVLSTAPRQRPTSFKCGQYLSVVILAINIKYSTKMYSSESIKLILSFKLHLFK